MSLPLLAEFPAILLPLITRARQTFQAALTALSEDALASFEAWPEARRKAFDRVCAASDFVTEQVCRDPQMLLQLADSGELERSLSAGQLRGQIADALSSATSDDELGRNLRRQRARQQVRIIWRDLTRQADLIETCRDLSEMADASIDLAYQWLYPRHCEQFGTPTGRHSGQPQHMVILGMGKLGAVELNLSSDIDLIFAYPEGGETLGTKRALDNQEFFIRLGQRLIKALDPVTVDGFVFRVDMRLRPYGSSGALVLSFNALEQYYQDQGRDWERYAMIKARVVGGDQTAGAELLDMLRPFVYRRYLDFSAIEALRTMKQLIQQEVKRKGMAENIKLGAGGIREVEFIAQAFQLIHGGRDLSLQQRPLFKVLKTLEGQGYLPSAVTEELREGYEFLRYTEHAIQAIADRQTQMLPDNDQDQARIALIMGFADWVSFHERLMYWRSRVSWHFRQVIADPDSDPDDEQQDDSEVAVGGEWLPLWEESQDEEAAGRQLLQAGFVDAEKALKNLASLRSSPNLRSMQRLSRERLDAFIPRLLAQAVEHEKPDLVLERVLPLSRSGRPALGVSGVADRKPRCITTTVDPVRCQPMDCGADRTLPAAAR
ncbi:Glutamate-ammonia-ligase adenylyltransferase [Pseudomonas amygdali pv. sesami]|nr:Glutamate-ammonia-ligase adenylyltransferase [Pseudomonas amygdali pv. sesami]